MSINFKNGGYSGLKIKIVTLAAVIAITGGAALAPVASFAADMTIAQLQAQIAALTAQLAAMSGGSTSSAAMTGSCNFTRNLSQGARGGDVKCLQQALNEEGYTVAASGPGSTGNETTYFGPATKAAVVKWQATVGLPAFGFFGPLSRTAFANSSTGGTTTSGTTKGGTTTGGTTTGGTTTGGTTTTGAAGALTVSAPQDQPVASLAPGSAARLPFTKVVLTASSAGDVTVNSVTAQRQSLAADAPFLGVVLLDQNGTQIGVAKTLNALHQVVLTGPVVIKAGTSKTLTIAANMDTAANLASYAGQVAQFAVVAIDAGSSSVSGPLPIAGNGMTINSSLTIGSVTMQRGSLDPGSSVSKPVGTTGYTFSSVRVTAGSAERVYLANVRWNQTGSIGSGDLANLKTYVDGTAYDVTVSSDGKYYTAAFSDNAGKGLLIDKGFSKEISIKGDISGGSGRTIQFDIAKKTDIALTGELYNYGIIPPATGSSVPSDHSTSAFSSSEDPWYNSASVTVQNGTMNVSASASVPAQNIAVNVSNQPLGAFTFDVKGEQISVGTLVFHLDVLSGSSATIAGITNVTLVDQNGNVVAGPSDAANTSSSITVDGKVTFSNTVTFPIGVNTFKLLGKLSTAFPSNATLTASTTPSTDFTTVKGLTTGNSITGAPASAVTASTMTVKAGALTISVSSVPIAQTVVANTKQFTFANYIFDATASGEDVRITTIPLALDKTGGAKTDLTSCQLYDGATSITTGSNVLNPTTSSASSTNMTFDGNGLIVPKQTTKIISMKCDIASGVTGVYAWGLADNSATFTGATGVTSGQTITEAMNASQGQYMTASSGGSLSAVLDANSPSYKIVGSGTTGVELSRIKFTATKEDIDLKEVALLITQNASNSPVDLVGRQVTLWDAQTNTQVGTAVFPTANNATSSQFATGAFRVTRDASRLLIVKGDIAAITNSGPITKSGHIIAVDLDTSNLGSGSAGTYGTGVSSGSTINTTAGSYSNSSGVRLMKAYPVLVKQSLPTNTLTAGSATNVKLYRFSVAANNGDVALFKFSFQMGSSSLMGTTSLYSLYAYTDSGYSSIDSNFSNTGLLNGGNCFNGLVSTAAGPKKILIYMDKGATAGGCNTATTTYIVPAGVTRYFELRGSTASVSAVSTSKDTITVYLVGDSAYPANSNELMGQSKTPMVGASTGGIDNDANNNFVWSPISTTTQITVSDLDYTNGYQVNGLPSTGMAQETLQN